MVIIGIAGTAAAGNVPLDGCLIRRLERDVNDRGQALKSVLTQYQATVRPGFFNHRSPSCAHADLIVPEGVRTQPP